VIFISPHADPLPSRMLPTHTHTHTHTLTISTTYMLLLKHGTWNCEIVTIYMSTGLQWLTENKPCHHPSRQKWTTPLHVLAVLPVRYTTQQCHILLIRYTAPRPHFTQNLPITLGESRSPSNIEFPGHIDPHRISIDLAIFPQYTRITNKQTGSINKKLTWELKRPNSSNSWDEYLEERWERMSRDRDRDRERQRRGLRW